MTSGKSKHRDYLAIPALAGVLVLLATQPLVAQEYTGTVSFEGAVSFADPNLGLLINEEDLTVTVRSDVGASGPGVKCDVGAITSDNPDPDGTYPGATGQVSVQLTMRKTGQCIVTVVAKGTDGVSTSARGSTTVFVDPNDILADRTFTGVDITLSESKAVAGLSLECRKWMKKQHKKRAKCNILILKKGGEIAAPKCKDACTAKDPWPCEPDDCDPSDYIEQVLAFSYDSNDQQALEDPNNGVGVSNYLDFKDQVICQKHFGFGAANYLKKRDQLVQVNCIDDNLDSEACRATQSQTAKNTLDRITKCVGDQMVDPNAVLPDPNAFLIVPDVASPCASCINSRVIDTKCMRDCFQSVLNEYSDLIIGDVPECGNGIKQPPEECDDGNLTNGDGCDSNCKIEI